MVLKTIPIFRKVSGFRPSSERIWLEVRYGYAHGIWKE
jgi:hypothetical protein